MSEENDWITTREFVETLYADSGRTAVIGLEDAMSAARREGWIDAQDYLDAEEVLTRRSAAVILHRFLLKVLGERDEADISAAEELKDLYDCRVCVNHIAQVYVKGIMEGIDFPARAENAVHTENAAQTDGRDGFRIFDGKGGVTRKDAERFIVRTMQRTKRQKKLKNRIDRK